MITNDGPRHVGSPRPVAPSGHPDQRWGNRDVLRRSCHRASSEISFHPKAVTSDGLGSSPDPSPRPFSDQPIRGVAITIGGTFGEPLGRPRRTLPTRPDDPSVPQLLPTSPAHRCPGAVAQTRPDWGALRTCRTPHGVWLLLLRQCAGDQSRMLVVQGGFDSIQATPEESTNEGARVTCCVTSSMNRSSIPGSVPKAFTHPPLHRGGRAAAQTRPLRRASPRTRHPGRFAETVVISASSVRVCVPIHDRPARISVSANNPDLWGRCSVGVRRRR